MYKKCILCGVKFKATNKNKKYCSRQCYGISITGDKNPACRIDVRKKLSIQKMGNKNPSKRLDVRKKISISLSGKNNPRYGTHRSKEIRDKISVGNRKHYENSEERKKISIATKLAMKRQDVIDKMNKHFDSIRGKTYEELYGEKKANKLKSMLRNVNIGNKNNKGKHVSDDAKLKMRLAYLKYKESKLNNNGKLYPNYNIEACKIIDEYGKANGYNFQHAENGGEFYIKTLGYWVDGYDKIRNTVIEYYERAHKNKVNRDESRKQEIVSLLNCKFIELREWEISDALP